MSDDPHDHRQKTNFTSPFENRVERVRRRQNKIVAEIQANRRREYKVPTWVLTVALAAILLGVLAFLLFG